MTETNTDNQVTKKDDVKIPEPEEILEAVRKGYRHAVREHRALGRPMVFWRDGKVIVVPPKSLPNVDDPDGRAQ